MLILQLTIVSVSLIAGFMLLVSWVVKAVSENDELRRALLGYNSDDYVTYDEIKNCRDECETRINENTMVLNSYFTKSLSEMRNTLDIEIRKYQHKYTTLVAEVNTALYELKKEECKMINKRYEPNFRSTVPSRPPRSPDILSRKSHKKSDDFIKEFTKRAKIDISDIHIPQYTPNNNLFPKDNKLFNNDNNSTDNSPTDIFKNDIFKNDKNIFTNDNIVHPKFNGVNPFNSVNFETMESVDLGYNIIRIDESKPSELPPLYSEDETESEALGFKFVKCDE